MLISWTKRGKRHKSKCRCRCRHHLKTLRDSSRSKGKKSTKSDNNSRARSKDCKRLIKKSLKRCVLRATHSSPRCKQRLKRLQSKHHWSLTCKRHYWGSLSRKSSKSKLKTIRKVLNWLSIRDRQSNWTLKCSNKQGNGSRNKVNWSRVTLRKCKKHCIRWRCNCLNASKSSITKDKTSCLKQTGKTKTWLNNYRERKMTTREMSKLPNQIMMSL